MCFHKDAAQLIASNMEVFRQTPKRQKPTARSAQREKAVAQAVALAKRLSPPSKQPPIAETPLPQSELDHLTGGGTILLSWNRWQTVYRGRSQNGQDRDHSVFNAVQRQLSSGSGAFVRQAPLV